MRTVSWIRNEGNREERILHRQHQRNREEKNEARNHRKSHPELLAPGLVFLRKLAGEDCQKHDVVDTEHDLEGYQCD